MGPASQRSDFFKMGFSLKCVVAGILFSLFVSGCSAVVDHRGYLPRSDDLQKIQMGMSKQEVQSILGSPSTTATLNHRGDSYYYVSSTVENKAFYRPQVTEREVVAVRFDENDQVTGFGHYGLEDGKVVNFSSRETPVEGKELSLINDFLGNLGKFDPGTGAK
jgi:outer membrane protein assembly factor BamE (lipoprotein component of BamABCDE complex)